MSFDGALAKLADHKEGPLVEQFQLVLSELAIGENRSYALRKMADRLDIPELTAVVSVADPVRAAREPARQDPAGAGERGAQPPPHRRRGAGDEGAGEDGAPDRDLHLPVGVHRDHRACADHDLERVLEAASGGPASAGRARFRLPRRRPCVPRLPGALLESAALADVAQLARASACHAEGRGFESLHPLPLKALQVQGFRFLLLSSRHAGLSRRERRVASASTTFVSGSIRTP